jgi:hypothetical protein
MSRRQKAVPSHYLMSQKEPAQVASAVSAYYHIPPIWIGEPPSEQEFHHAPVQVLIADVHESDLGCGVKVRVRRDDCSSLIAPNGSLARQQTYPASNRGQARRSRKQLQEPGSLLRCAQMLELS